MIALIAARSKNNVIGKDGKIPWNIPGEQKQFRKLTTGNIVVMGRKTFEEIGHPLPNRKNIVISRNAQYPFDNLVVLPSLTDALDYYLEGDIYIAGGYNLFREAIDIVDKMYLTEVDLFIENGDVFFPEFQEEDFNTQLLEENYDFIPYKRLVYSRKNKGIVYE